MWLSYTVPEDTQKVGVLGQGLWIKVKRVLLKLHCKAGEGIAKSGGVHA